MTSLLQHTDHYHTRGGITVHRVIDDLPAADTIEPILDALNNQRGALFASSYEYPGRYTRWDMGFINPPLAVGGRGLNFWVSALNERGGLLLPAITAVLEKLSAVASLEVRGPDLIGSVTPTRERFPEEQRSQQPSLFSVLRALVQLFYSTAEPHLGLYGAFGYDLAFQFEPLRLRLERPADQRDLVLYLPDELIVVDHRRERAMRRSYEFEVDGHSTHGIPRSGERRAYQGNPQVKQDCDHKPGEYAAGVTVAKAAFKKGDLFEVVPGQTFFEGCPASPAELFRRLRERNPSPYGFLINLGQDEYLVGASPEMYVRVEGRRVETCPISGTIARGQDAITDADRILELLTSKKDESELTMCTDVDRNDKSRICEPGSVRVIGRRQIEMYSRLIHTVDHVEGYLRDGFDALDAFLAHTWAVTVTGAPKAWAMQFIEDHEKSPRAWYGGAVGLIGFNGSLNTGLTLRTIRLKDGVAQVRAGATLLYDSDPQAEEEETHIKASAFLDAIRRPRGLTPEKSLPLAPVGRNKKILLIDHQDSFVHTLANYLRQTGADVLTLRAGFPECEFETHQPDLVVLSPGPGEPKDFNLSETLDAVLKRHLPVFGVCLGLQGIVEYFGGRLATLSYPMHGKPSEIRVLDGPGAGRLYDNLPGTFRAARYHSLFALRDSLPACLCVTAESDDGVVMAVEHTALPVAAVQFHPESILTLQEDLGLRLMHNVVETLTTPRKVQAA